MNGGTLDGKTGIVKIKATNGSVIVLPAPTRDGYVFDYWEGSRYNAGDRYTVSGNHTFNAVWKIAANDKKKKGSSKNGVDTGDENDLTFWIILMSASLAGAAGMAFVSSRRK